MKKFLFTAVVACLFGGSAHAGLVNGGFESVTGMPAGTDPYTTDAGNVTGWKTTASDNKIEVWTSGCCSWAGSQTPAYAGSHFAELNANEVSTLFQESSGIAAGSIVGYEFAHRGRRGMDTMEFLLTDLGTDNVLGGGDDTVLFSMLASDSNSAWGFYSGTGLVALGNTVRFSFVSVSSAGGDKTVGNFLDAADFGVGVGAPAPTAIDVPEPASLALVGAALAGAVGASRRKRA